MVGDDGIPLIPRRTFFGNANAVNPRLSPDACWLSWIAPVAGVMNVWVSPRDDVTQARPLTRQGRSWMAPAPNTREATLPSERVIG